MMPGTDAKLNPDFERSTHELSKKLVLAEVDHGPRPQDACLVEDRDLDLLSRSEMIRMRHLIRDGVRYVDAFTSVAGNR